ncbi:choice-of-anchor D domain-containing protein [Actinoplanes sp. NPDC051346]|uniref:choice-of-anchor D domain-containing protein n=1 Tax=Actinoplanes sp. NPDC051346 TaxID=3155048 RepID=UPI00341CC46A
MVESAFRSLRAASAVALLALLVASAPPAYAGLRKPPEPAAGPAFEISVAGSDALPVGEPAGAVLGLTPGGSAVVVRGITTATIPPRPDVVLLADTTASMQAALNNVRVNAGRLVEDIKTAQPDARFAVAEFRDMTDEYAFLLRQDLTADVAAVQQGVNAWAAEGGGDTPEAGLNALYAIATGAVALREGSSPIVVIFGDAPSHNPSGGHDLASTIDALIARGIRVVAVDITRSGRPGLDEKGQFTEITVRTGGVLLQAAEPAAVASAILTGIRAIQATVEARITRCDPALSATVSPDTSTVDSGAAVDLTLSVAVDPKARNGEYACELQVTVDGVVGEPERIAVRVTGAAPDVPVLHSDTTLVDLGEVPLGTAAPARAVTLTNVGDYPLTISAALAEEPVTPAVFALDGSTCGDTLPVATSCVVSVGATPQQIGVATSVLHLTSATDTGGQAAQALTLTVAGRSPTLQFNPGVGRPDQVINGLGRGFPPGGTVSIEWTNGSGAVSVVADATGAFAVPMMVFEDGIAGPRRAVASVPGVGEVTSGSFLVQTPTAQPGVFTRRR